MVQRIKDLCKQTGVRGLHDLEERTGIGFNTIYKWDKASPAAEKVCKVADFFNVSVDWLLDRQTEPPDAGMTMDEKELLSLFRSVSVEGKAAIMTAARAFAGQVDYTKKESASVTA